MTTLSENLEQFEQRMAENELELLFDALCGLAKIVCEDQSDDAFNCFDLFLDDALRQKDTRDQMMRALFALKKELTRCQAVRVS